MATRISSLKDADNGTIRSTRPRARPTATAHSDWHAKVVDFCCYGSEIATFGFASPRFRGPSAPKRQWVLT